MSRKGRRWWMAVVDGGWWMVDGGWWVDVRIHHIQCTTGTRVHVYSSTYTCTVPHYNSTRIRISIFGRTSVPRPVVHNVHVETGQRIEEDQERLTLDKKVLRVFEWAQFPRLTQSAFPFVFLFWNKIFWTRSLLERKRRPDVGAACSSGSSWHWLLHVCCRYAQ